MAQTSRIYHMVLKHTVHARESASTVRLSAWHIINVGWLLTDQYLGSRDL
jgi:hypothetical protein